MKNPNHTIRKLGTDQANYLELFNNNQKIPLFRSYIDFF